MRTFFMQTERIGFSIWTDKDIGLAKRLWGNTDVTKYISANGAFTINQIEARLQTEINNQKNYNIQYWCIFTPDKFEFIGCCGLRPSKNGYEVGVHLLKDYWGKGYATEAILGVIKYAFSKLNATKLFSGHHPNNINSEKMLKKVGFQANGTTYYEPTKLNHPWYEMDINQFRNI